MRGDVGILPPRWVTSATALLGAVAIATACSERFPREQLPPAPAATTEPASGLDARPVSATCTARAPAEAKARIGFSRLGYPELHKPVELATRAGRLYVLEQEGLMKVLEPDGKTVSVALDLTSRLAQGGEAGLLGLAFHPSFDQNGFVYLYYTSPHPEPKPAGVAFQSVLARFESKDGGSTLDPSSEKRLLVVDQPYANHNGGTIAFGNDGFLYWGLGDGGSGGDPHDHAQNPASLLGKMLRIDVDGGDPYAIPADNPFAAGGGRAEIYALGFRNPYRFRFDRPTGDLWLGDVGQHAREEIDRVVLGGNYGWRIREGKTCFDPKPCDPTGLIDPVVDHGRTEAIAITGGVVYRGSAIPELAGQYVYADIGTDFFFAIPTDVAAPAPVRLDEGLEQVDVDPSAFALDADGEILVLGYGTGAVFRIVPPEPPPETPALLSETGCLTTEGLFPYDVIVSQWQDGLEADRYLSIPEGLRMTVSAEGRLELPPGAVAVRTVHSGERRVETQLLLVRPDGTKGAYAYAWSDDQTDATFDAQASASCTTCHEEARGRFVIGLETAQLDRDFDFPAGRTGNVLSTLGRLGMIDPVVDPLQVDALAALGADEPARRRAQSYLRANCSYCHLGDASATLGACNGPRIVAAMRAEGAGRMPPLGTVVPHDAAIAAIEEWLRSIPTCP